MGAKSIKHMQSASFSIYIHSFFALIHHPMFTINHKARFRNTIHPCPSAQ